MKLTLTLFTALLLAPLAALAEQTPAAPTAGLVGDGTHDDTTAIQALLDSKRTLVRLPAPPQALSHQSDAADSLEPDAATGTFHRDPSQRRQQLTGLTLLDHLR